MPDDVKATRAKLREQLHEIEFTEPRPLPAAYAFVSSGETCSELLCPAHGRPASSAGAGGSGSSPCCQGRL